MLLQLLSKKKLLIKVYFEKLQGKSKPHRVSDLTYKHSLCYSVNIICRFVNGSIFILLFYYG